MPTRGKLIEAYLIICLVTCATAAVGVATVRTRACVWAAALVSVVMIPVFIAA